MRGDALASGSKSAKFNARDLKDENVGEKFDEAVKDLTPERRPVFCRCNAKGCEDFVFYTATEFSNHVHDVHFVVPF